MAQQLNLLNRVSEMLDSPAAQLMCHESFNSNKTWAMHKDDAFLCAQATFESLNQLLRSSGINVRSLTHEEIKSFVEAASTKKADVFTAKEFQAMMAAMAKYAALQGRRNAGKRWGVGMSLSAAGGLLVGASLKLLPGAAATGLMAAATPVGVAVGGIILLADGRRLPNRDRRRAARHVYSSPAPALPDAQEAAADTPGTGALEPLAVQEAEPEIAPAPEEAAAPDAHQDGSCLAAQPACEAAELPATMTSIGSNRSEELVSAVVEVLTPAHSNLALKSLDAAAADDGVALHQQLLVTDDGDESLALPALLKPASPDPLVSCQADGATGSATFCPSPSKFAAMADVPVDPVESATAALPPLALTKKPSGTKKLKKSISKSFKKLGKALSMNSSDLDAAAAAAVARADGDQCSLKPPKPAGFLRRSFSGDPRRISTSSLADSAGDLVQQSEGSATIRKMKDLIRRSFTLSTPRASMDGSTKGGSRVRAF